MTKTKRVLNVYTIFGVHIYLTVYEDEKGTSITTLMTDAGKNELLEIGILHKRLIVMLHLLKSI